MVKSSDVLRLAAELEFRGDYGARVTAARRLGATDADMRRQKKYCGLVNWLASIPCSEQAVMALCLAATIAESEGD